MSRRPCFPLGRMGIHGFCHGRLYAHDYSVRTYMIFRTDYGSRYLTEPTAPERPRNGYFARSPGQGLLSPH